MSKRTIIISILMAMTIIALVVMCLAPVTDITGGTFVADAGLEYSQLDIRMSTSNEGLLGVVPAMAINNYSTHSFDDWGSVAIWYNLNGIYPAFEAGLQVTIYRSQEAAEQP